VVTNVTDKHSVSIFTSTLQMVAVYPFEMTVTTYTVTQCYNPDDQYKYINNHLTRLKQSTQH